MESFWRDFGRNVFSGLKLAVFMRVRAENIRPSWSQLVALIVFGLLVTFSAELASVGPRGQFSAYAVPGVMFYVPLSLVTAWGMALLARRPEQALTLAVALLALAVPIDLAEPLYRAGLRKWSPGWMRGAGYYYAYYLPHLWLVLAAAAAAVRIFALRLALCVPALLIAAVLLGLPQGMNWRGGLWTARYDEAENKSRYMALSNEDSFYLQPKLLERELAALKPGRKGTVDLYFVGVAGYANQDVFMKEVNSVGKLFRERFDTEGHSVRLINNAKSVADTPVASVTALKATLARLAEVMDRDEDILFLFLTSHGSKDHHFSLEFWPIRFNPLDPKALRKLLDDSGIKRRVIVVSACYSGGFVDALKDENSLVITASAADHNSFGCSNEADFTYFGKAYFDEALRETYSFIEAFERAKPKIAAREKEQGYDGSGPQISIGEGIRRPLAVLEKRLKLGTAARARTAPPSGKYADFVNLWVRPELIAGYRSECARNMAEGSPAYYVRKDPNYFGGLNENSRHWPRLMVAWAKYSEEYCAAINNEKLFRQVYLDSYRRRLAEHDLDAVAKFFRTEPGQRFVSSTNKVGVDLMRGLLERSRPSTDRATRLYTEEQVRINADFQRDREAVEKK